MAMARVVGYARVSTREQAEEGISLDDQKAQIRAYCTMRGLDLVEVLEDPGVSGSEALCERNGGRGVLDLVAENAIDGVVAWKLDRLFRDCVDCLSTTRTWDNAGVALHLIDLGGQAVDTSSAMGRFFLTVMAGAAELERNQISERTKAAMSYLKGQGVQLGAPALGTDEGEAETVRRIVALRAGGSSLRAIANTLTVEGYSTKRGGKWAPETISKVLDRTV